MAPYVTAFVGLGSNLGDRQQNIAKAYELIGKLPKTRSLRLSALIETAPENCPPGSPSFMNAVAKVETKLTARELLAGLLDVEKQLGRARSGVRNEPRTLDLDLLLFGDNVINEPDLIVPHPRMHQREFVLWPLLQIDSRVRDPRTGNPFADAYATLKGRP